MERYEKQGLHADISEAIDLIEELVMQGMWTAASLTEHTYNDMAISTYQDASDYLVRVRPDRWKREPYGLRYIGGGD